ncbi:MAG: hypothetical protein JRJ87_20305 [Deltaproteobacteria bacterium]|nr:hypothetical protein [Deltaproteobacteria bacterium]
MEVKGTAVRSTPLFVRQRFSSRFDEWADSLSAEARKVMLARISTSAWFPLQTAMIEPTQKICDLFFEGDSAGALEIGRFSADYSLWGLYRLFIKIGSPSFLIKRATSVFSTYYRPCKMILVEQTPLSALVRITEFAEPNELVELRIIGWMERALKISGCSDVQTKITKSLTRGEDCTEIVAQWR